MWMRHSNDTSQSTVRCALFGGLMILLCAVTCTAANSIPPVMDANALVILTYQKAQSFTETSESRIVSSSHQEFFQTSKLTYKRPNLLLILSTDPKQGTFQSVCDGSTATFYSGKLNLFMRRNAPATVGDVLVSVSRSSDDLVSSPQIGMLSPTSFLVAKGMPNEAKTFHYVSTQTIEGHRAALVKATADPVWLKSLFPKHYLVTFQHKEISLWIDLDTKLLVRASCDITWQIQTEHNPISGNLTFNETHTHLAINAPLRDEIFNFVPPKGAIEKFPETR
jgi:outer membrane lipoprotein-sorting protein